jgi:hypothetical protein
MAPERSGPEERRSSPPLTVANAADEGDAIATADPQWPRWSLVGTPSDGCPLALASPGGSPRNVPLLVRRDLLCPRLAPGDGPASALLTRPGVFGPLGRGEKVGAGGLRLLGSAGLVHHARSVPQATPRRPAAVRRTTCHPIERRRTTRWHCGGRRTRSIQAWPGTRDNEPPACRIEWPTRPLRFPLREVRLPPRHLVRPVAQGRAVQGCFPIGAAHDDRVLGSDFPEHVRDEQPDRADVKWAGSGRPPVGRCTRS